MSPSSNRQLPRTPSAQKVVDYDPEDLEPSEFGTEPEEDDVSVTSITPVIRRSKIMIFIVLLLGIGGGIAFIVLGIQNENKVANKNFEIRATQLVKDITSTVEEYEVAARSVQNVCRRRETTRHQFRQFYEYLISGGLQVQAAQCVPNVTHDERLAFEASARAYYTEFYPGIVNYTGFRGWEYDEATDTYPVVEFRSPAPFYFPVDKSEPVVSNAAALGLDAYSHPFQKLEIEQALATHLPVLGGRLKLVQETEENAYTVIMRHPGIRVDDEGGVNLDNSSEVSRDLGNILIRIPSLLKRRGQEQKESIACYLYDITPSRTDGVETYLGAAEYEARVADGTVVTDVNIPPEDVEYDVVVAANDKNRIFKANIAIASNALWTVVVTPIPGDESFDPEFTELIFGGAMLILCAIGLAIFLWRNMEQVKKIHEAKRQAEAERTIIAGLYPENVVGRLLEDERAKQEATKERIRNKGKIFDGKGSNCGSTAGSTSSPLERCDSHGHEDFDEHGNVLSIFGTDPIAHHYEETTVLFMDMVGFTAWSRTREPAQVFTLLENTYNAFDVLAKRRRVYKVETVGDCYVAVVGVPDPRKNHATIMALFAHACLQRMATIMNQLAKTLGEDTTKLSLRVGMSSGPVVGGVLRGEKGRFQLFGDTMNTAARMESNGEAGMIHVSQSTADRLLANGRGKWLMKRDDQVVAKGLGQVTTYWVKVNSDSLTSGDCTQNSEDNSSPRDDIHRSSIGHSSGSDSMEDSPTLNRKKANRAQPVRSSMEHMMKM